MSVRFYNPASRITETLRYDGPLRDDLQHPLPAYHSLEAEGQSFFEVPTQVGVSVVEGEEPQMVSVTLPRIVKDQYRFSHCVVMVDPHRDVKKKPIAEEDNVATNDKDAKAKAELLWQDAMFALAREHEINCLTVRNNGFKPQRAKGNVAHALKTLGIEDPANDIEDVVKRKIDTSENEDLKKRLAALEKLLIEKVK